MLDRWIGLRAQNQRYGHSDESYIKAAGFLDIPGKTVQDWGCGGGYARQFFKNASYLGVDGTNDFCDVQADLRTYQTNSDGILLRHVLEHNFEWEKILKNAIASCEKLCVIIFTPFGDETKQVGWNPGYEVPDISFRKEDLTKFFPKYTEETIESPNVYTAPHNTETIFYVMCEEGEEDAK